MKLIRVAAVVTSCTSLLGCAESDEPVLDGRAGNEGEVSSADPSAALQASSRTGIRVLDVKAFGSGCPSGTAHANVAREGAKGDAFFEVFFDQLGLSFDARSTSALQMKSCQLRVDFAFDERTRVAIRQLTFSGERSLGADQTARLETDFGWSGDLLERSITTFQGPTSVGDEFFSHTDRRPDDNFSVCDTTARLFVNITASLDTTIDPTRSRPSGHINVLQARHDGTASELQLAMAARSCTDQGNGR